MEWTTLIAALLGAAIATGTTLLTETRRDRREATADWRRTRLDTYSASLTGFANAYNGLIALSKFSQQLTDAERDEQARQIFTPCYELRHRLEMIASPEVTELNAAYYRSVRSLRIFVAEGGNYGSGESEVRQDEIYATRTAMIAAMRIDLSPTARLSYPARVRSRFQRTGEGDALS